MLSQVASSGKLPHRRLWPRWCTPGALAVLPFAIGLILVGRATQVPPPVEAPGFLTAISDHETQIAAYVPPDHPEYVLSGTRAVVIFPDGSRHLAAITDSTTAAGALPNRELLGDTDLGTLVRMDFVDGAGADRSLLEGLPVKLRFTRLSK